MTDISTIKLPVPTFLKMLTSNKVPTAKAMSITGKIYKSYSTPAMLAELTDLKLKSAGVDDKEERKLVLAAVRKSGYKQTTGASSSKQTSEAGPSTSTVARHDMSALADPVASTSSKNVAAGASTSRRKRKRQEDHNEFLPDRSAEELEEETYGSLEFNEVVDEETLRLKFVVVNRAPIMTAWSFIVAERLGFKREEALSIASVYTEMNAISKGVSIGIYDKSKKDGVEASRGGSQPYVDLMGRRPLYHTAKSTWLALSQGKPVSPASSYSYITRSLRQTTPFVIGALRLLGESYTPAELNKHGFSLYMDFRPEVKEWGGRGEIRCAKILGLRKEGRSKSPAPLPKGEGPTVGDEGPPVGVTTPTIEGDGKEDDDTSQDEPESKKPRTGSSMTLEEYEAALDAEDAFNDVELDLPDLSSNSVVKDI